MVGNSSSGIIEVPSFGIPTVNIGDRQRGRVCAGSVISCGNAIEEIQKALDGSIIGGFL
ncbi:MAG: UDP-N-acetylglucosamine 2-epimerase [Roseburia sp.]